MDPIKNGDAEVKLELFPLNEHESIVRIQLDPDVLDDTSEANAVQTVIVLDKSGSMGNAVPRVTNDIIPKALIKLGYKPTDRVHLIMFDTNASMEAFTVERLKTLQASAEGGTKMAPAVEKYKTLSQSLDEKKPIRLLTISDGEVADITETEKAASSLIEFMKTKNFSINSQAVRLFTSNSQPDTRAVCSLLQLNNVTSTNLADISANESNDAIAEKIKQLFEDDDLSNSHNLATQSKVIFKYPWDSTPVSSFSMVPGENLFWIKGNEAVKMHIRGKAVKTERQPKLTIDTFQQLMKDKMIYIVDHMKVLKVVGTDKANRKVKTMLKYFEEKENNLLIDAPPEDKAKTDPSQLKKLSALLSRIANDESVAGLSLAQKADYLREEVVIDVVSPEKVDQPTSEAIEDKVSKVEPTVDMNSNEVKPSPTKYFQFKDKNLQLASKRYFPLVLAGLAILALYLKH